MTDTMKRPVGFVTVLRDMLADQMLQWLGGLIKEPVELEHFAGFAVSLMEMRISRYLQERPAWRTPRTQPVPEPQLWRRRDRHD